MRSLATGVPEKRGRGMKLKHKASAKARVAKEVGTGLALLAVSGGSVGGFLGMVVLASRALGR